MNTATPAVSVILPTHNRERTLRRAIDSVLAQTFRDFELIVVDDASTDGTRALVETIADPRVRYLRLPSQSWPAKARNHGIKSARADLLAFQDSDDEWLPEKLERQVALMRASPPDVGLVVGGFKLVEPHQVREIRSERLERGEDYGLDIIQGVPLVTPVWLVKKDAIERAGLFDETLASAEDYDLGFRLSRICRFRAVPERVLVKQGHAESLSANEPLLLRGIETVLERYPEFWEPYPREKARMLALVALLHRRQGARRAAVRAMIRSLRARPRQPRLILQLAAALFSPGALWALVTGPYRRRQAEPRGPRVMEAFGRNFPAATFVQIGSNDGDKHDPLRATMLRHRWSGVMVEPVPYVFQRLQKNYAGWPGIVLENVAVSATPGADTLPFYYVAQAQAGEAVPDWYDELGSFRKEVVMSHADRIPNLEQRLVTTDVPCVSFAELCRRNGLEKVELIHMDTEGYDGQLLQAMDFSRHRPVLLIYEHKHLAADERRRCQALLAREGYALFEEAADTWCADLRATTPQQRKFLKAWRRLARPAPQPASIHS